MCSLNELLPTSQQNDVSSNHRSLLQGYCNYDGVNERFTLDCTINIENIIQLKLYLQDTKITWQCKQVEEFGAVSDEIPNIVFFDDTISTIRHNVSKQNDEIIYARLAARRHSPAQVMDWELALLFLESGVELNDIGYREAVLDAALWEAKHFGHTPPWTFQ